MMDLPIELKWKLASQADPTRLVVDYTLTNKGAKALWILDQMIGFAAEDGLERQPQELIVRSDEQEPTTVLLTRGYVSPPYSDVWTEIVPAARRLAPGERLVGHAETPLPLTERHPNESLEPLAVEPKRARLEIGIMPADLTLEETLLANGETVSTPRLADAFESQHFIRSETLPSPP